MHQRADEHPGHERNKIARPPDLLCLPIAPAHRLGRDAATLMCVYATLIRSDERAVTTTDWLVSRHGFSFGDHYDPDNTHHGTLLIFNDDTVTPGGGYDLHRHRNSEILTWVLEGVLSHRDSDGNEGSVPPGVVQRMSAGAGVEHSERNDAATPVHFIQMTLAPDDADTAATYEHADVSADLARSVLVTLASGIPERPGAIGLGTSGAALHVARPAPGQSVTLPQARYVHVFVTSGRAEMTGLDLSGADTDGPVVMEAGDSLRLTDPEAGEDAATTAVSVRGIDPDTEILIWEMHRGLMDPA